MNIFNFWRKRPVATAPPDDRMDMVVEIGRLYGFFCKHCSAWIYDGRTDCLVCKAYYSPRVSEIAKWHERAKRRLVKKMDYDQAAHILKEAAENLAKDQKLSPQKVFAEICAFFKA